MYLVHGFILNLSDVLYSQLYQQPYYKREIAMLTLGYEQILQVIDCTWFADACWLLKFDSLDR